MIRYEKSVLPILLCFLTMLLGCPGNADSIKREVAVSVPAMCNATIWWWNAGSSDCQGTVTVCHTYCHEMPLECQMLAFSSDRKNICGKISQSLTLTLSVAYIRRPRPMVSAKAVRNQMVPSRADWRGETDNRATPPVGYCPSTVSFSVRLYCKNARRDRCQEYHNCFPFRELEETTRTPLNYVDEDYSARPEIKQSLTGWGDNCGSESSTLETDVCARCAEKWRQFFDTASRKMNKLY